MILACGIIRRNAESGRFILEENGELIFDGIPHEEREFFTTNKKQFIKVLQHHQWWLDIKRLKR